MAWIIGIVFAGALVIWAFGAALLAFTTGVLGAAAMVVGMFVIGSAPFWLLLATVSIGIIWSLSELDSAYLDHYNPSDPSHIGGGAFATFAIAVFAILLVISNYANPPSLWHWFYTPLAIVICLAGGIATSLWKWGVYVLDITEKFTEARAQFFEQHNLNTAVPIPERLRGSWNSSAGRYAVKPNEYRFVKLKTVWAVYWPWVLAWSLLHDVVTKTYRTIVVQFHGVYARITNHYWKRIEAQMPMFETEPLAPSDTEQRGTNRTR